MGKGSRAGSARLDAAFEQGAGLGSDGGVDEYGQIHLAERLHQLWSELVEAQDFDARVRHQLAQPLRDAPAQRVVAADGVAVANDESAGHGQYAAPLAGESACPTIRPSILGQALPPVHPNGSRATI